MNSGEVSVELQVLGEHFQLCALTRPAGPSSFGHLLHENGYEPTPQVAVPVAVPVPCVVLCVTNT